jgi:hypothetical protein
MRDHVEADGRGVFRAGIEVDEGRAVVGGIDMEAPASEYSGRQIPINLLRVAACRGREDGTAEALNIDSG